MFLKSTDGKLFLAPLEEDEIHHVLDVGTGTGLWAIDCGDQYPSATVVGTDLSPIQPSWVPPNVAFLIDDIEDEWIFDTKFDLVHARMMCGSLKDWPGFMQQAYNNLRPGGWIEFQDIDMPFRSDDGTYNEDTALWKWSDLLTRSGEIAGRTLRAAHQYKKWMEDAGFINVVETMHKWPQNTWPKDPKHKELGLWTMQNLLQGLQGLTVRPFTTTHKWSMEEIEVFLVDVRKDIQNRRIRSYWPMWEFQPRALSSQADRSRYLVYGQRPP